jgi:asparagine synthase (glutamine-hydrolysing)
VIVQNRLKQYPGVYIASPFADKVFRSWTQGDLRQLTLQFALVEECASTVKLYVDPFGLASLFFRIVGDEVHVSTEQLPLSEGCPLDESALQDVYALRFLPGRKTMWQGVHQVVPGSCVTIRSGEVSEELGDRIRWTPTGNESLAGAAQRTLDALQSAFGAKRSDGTTDVAILLSGGIDSSVMAALAAKYFPKCTALTAEIEGFANPELERARNVAARVGIPHKVIAVRDIDVKRLFPLVIERIQEPLRHYNNMVVARLLEEAAQHATCIIAGDSADLLFGGGELNTIWNWQRKKKFLSTWMAPLISLLRPSLGRVAALSMEELIQHMDVIKGHPSKEVVDLYFNRDDHPFEQFQYFHLRLFLTSIYRRNTRIAEEFGVTYWYPMKEAPVLDIALSLPRALKFDPQMPVSKRILREICDQLVGRDVSRWSKLGFPSPEREWIEGPLRDYLPDERLLNLDTQTIWTEMTLAAVLNLKEANRTGA